MARAGRKRFENDPKAYRLFLKIFSENPNFDDGFYKTAIEKAYRITYNMKNTIKPDIEKRLWDFVLKNKEKILKDLQIFKILPDPIKPPGSERLSEQQDEELEYEKRSSRSSKNIRVSNQNVDVQKYTSVRKKRKISCSKEVNKIPLVVLENDSSLKEMVRKLQMRRYQQENENSRECSSNEDNEDNNYIKETNGNDLEKHNESDVIVENNLAVSEKNANVGANVNFNVTNRPIIIKEEVDFVDNNIQIENVRQLPDSSNVFQRENINHNKNKSNTTESTYPDKTGSNLNSMNFNAGSFPIQAASGCDKFLQMPAFASIPMFNSSMSSNMNTSSYTMMPMAPFNPNFIGNQSAFLTSHGMFGPNPFEMFPQNPMFPMPYFGTPFEQHLVIQNQMNVVQEEIKRAEKQISILNSQLAHLQKTAADVLRLVPSTQSYSHSTCQSHTSISDMNYPTVFPNLPYDYVSQQPCLSSCCTPCQTSSFPYSTFPAQSHPNAVFHSSLAVQRPSFNLPQQPYSNPTNSNFTENRLNAHSESPMNLVTRSHQNRTVQSNANSTSDSCSNTSDDFCSTVSNNQS